MQDSHLIPQPGVLKLSPSLSFILNLTKPTHNPYHPSDDTFVILTIQYLLQLCICLGANLKPTHLLGAPVYKRKWVGEGSKKNVHVWSASCVDSPTFMPGYVHDGAQQIDSLDVRYVPFRYKWISSFSFETKNWKWFMLDILQRQVSLRKFLLVGGSKQVTDASYVIWLFSLMCYCTYLHCCFSQFSINTFILS